MKMGSNTSSILRTPAKQGKKAWTASEWAVSFLPGMTSPDLGGNAVVLRCQKDPSVLRFAKMTDQVLPFNFRPYLDRTRALHARAAQRERLFIDTAARAP
jgi:hypothetical protein